MNAHSNYLLASRIVLSAGLLCALAGPAFADDGAAKSAANSTDGANATTAAPATTATSAKPKPDREKKIYTNEDVEALARNYGLSTVGNAAPDGSALPVNRRSGAGQILVSRTLRVPLPPEKDPAWYAEQYLSLSARMDDIDYQVQQLRSFMASDAAPASGASGLNFGLNIYADCPAMTTDAHIQLLLQQRADLEAQVSDLEDRAQLNGIASGVFRNASAFAPAASGISTRESLNALQTDLAETRATEAAMHQEAAAQNVTLIPETRFGGSYTSDYLKQLSIQQAALQQQIHSVADTARHEGLPPNTLP
jgi:hypothetical protein